MRLQLSSASLGSICRTCIRRRPPSELAYPPDIYWPLQELIFDCTTSGFRDSIHVQRRRFESVANALQWTARSNRTQKFGGCRESSRYGSVQGGCCVQDNGEWTHKRTKMSVVYQSWAKKNSANFWTCVFCQSDLGLAF